MTLRLREDDALLIVDPQVDFCPGGALAVPEGDRIFAQINQAAPLFPIVLASQDYHPAGHVSFQDRGGPWPPHCVEGTPGVEFHPALDSTHIQGIVRKGTDPELEAYSAFDATGADLRGLLGERGVKRLFVAGLATDYCVRASVLDAREAGFQVVVLEDAIAPVDVQPGDGERALAEMEAAGATRARTSQLVPIA